jgi:hypothetical protein
MGNNDAQAVAAVELTGAGAGAAEQHLGPGSIGTGFESAQIVGQSGDAVRVDAPRLVWTSVSATNWASTAGTWQSFQLPRGPAAKLIRGEERRCQGLVGFGSFRRRVQQGSTPGSVGLREVDGAAINS